jgi:hypothetical protein
VSGTGFHIDRSKNKVQIESTVCQVESANAIEIRCRFVTGIAGPHPVLVTVAGKGKAKGSFTFKCNSQVTGVTPKKGGTGGKNQNIMTWVFPLMCAIL